ncbi:MAG: glycosyltransferase family 2 protein [Bacteroidetes bacterium]|nr:glycosyltransferase family 2 protein [Bacteroidota bacterium]
MTPKISIITVVYNGGTLLEKTILSVLSQTYSNIEYIIVDGKSTDNTLAIVEKYKSKIAKVISEKDSGLYHAMDKGLKLATGDYVWFMNCGDQINDEKTVEKIFAEKIAADIFYSDTALIDEEGLFLSLLSEVSHNKAPDPLTPKSMSRGMAVCHQSFIVKRSIAPPFELRYKISADIDWVIKCLKKSTVNYKLPFCLSKFLVGGISSQNRWTAVKERFVMYNHHFGLVKNLYNHIFVVGRVVKKMFK